jgi:pimeloyl-ACP methyl ester carboxylesterase
VAVPADLVRSVTTPTLVVAGGASPDFFLDTAARLTELLPDATSITLAGAERAAPADVVAPVVAAYVSC